MIITSKLLFGTLVVLIGLFIFVRGFIINFFVEKPLNTLDILNVGFSFAVSLIAMVIAILLLFIIFLEILDNYVKPFIVGLWNGEKQLFKPFKINFKFKKKHD